MPASGAMPRGVHAGDVLLGLPSSGVHSNGFSLVRRIVEVAGLKYTDPAPFDSSRTLADALLTPTRIYVKQVWMYGCTRACTHTWQACVHAMDTVLRVTVSRVCVLS